MADTKIVVLDDDPTGSQTVHGCLLLTRRDVDTLRMALADPAPLFFVLTNTRGMEAARAATVTREVCRHLRAALAGTSMQPIFVSRSDSTLRGHFPVETDVMTEELGPFDAQFLVPAFFEGGRVTRAGTHYLRLDGRELPVHETEFARDSVFGYRHSYLPDYIEEKTRGRVRASAVARVTLEDVRGDVLARLQALPPRAWAVVDAERQADLDRFAAAVRAAAAAGRRFLFRSAASLLTALARLPPQPVAPQDMGRYVRDGRPGAVVVGSHVHKTTRQLERLLQAPEVVPLELDVARLAHGREAAVAALAQAAAQAHGRGATPVIYTSRRELTFADPAARLAFGEQVSGALMELVRRLPATLGYLVSKGGITSNDVLSQALALPAARVLGQVLPGVSVIQVPADHDRFPSLPVVIFPGNVGDDDALLAVYRRFDARMARNRRA